MKGVLFSVLLLLGMAGVAYAQQTANNERTGWYASNPWSLAVIAIPLLAIIAIGAFLVLRGKL